MKSTGKERKAILKRNLKSAGIRNLTSIDESYTFTVETLTGINLCMLAELTENALIMTGTLDIKVDPKDKPTMALLGEYLHKANCGMTLSKFELDYEEGDIWFAACTRYYNVYPEHDAYKDMIASINSIVDIYSSGIIDIVTGSCTDVSKAYENSKSTIMKFIAHKHVLNILDKIIGDKRSDSDDQTSQKDSPKSIPEDVSFSKEFKNFLNHLINNENNNT